jgi:hypothetical protein
MKLNAVCETVESYAGWELEESLETVSGELVCVGTKLNTRAFGSLAAGGITW